LSINLCPKFHYDDQVIGQYTLEDNKIDKIDPKYLGLISMNIHLKKSSTPHCETCPFVVFCPGFCCKESYRFSLNPIIPLRESCEMKRTKYALLFYKLKHFGILTEENLIKADVSPFYKNYMMILYSNITGGNQNE
jgi:radical SAM protein with 4Fe4S-binding SPASM domain